MAECWGRLSRQVGVCAVSSGVAHANALSGVVNAHFDGAPMLLISGAGPLQTAGKGHFQDFDQVGLAAPVCKYAHVLDDAQRIPEIVGRAFKEALVGRPGPVHLTFPLDVQETVVEEQTPLEPVAVVRKAAADHEAIGIAVDWLEMAERPLIVAGSGAYYAHAERRLQDFVGAYAVPVVVPIWDRGVVAAYGEEYMGVVGAASGGPELLAAADLVLALGAAPDYRVGYLEAPVLAASTRVIRNFSINWGNRYTPPLPDSILEYPV
jgi:acetolactate synthase-1/2/3 large subunit